MEITFLGGFTVACPTLSARQPKYVTLWCPQKYFNRYKSSACPISFRVALKATNSNQYRSETTSLQQPSPEDLLKEIQRLREENERLKKYGDISTNDVQEEPSTDDRTLGLPLEDGKFLPFIVVDVKKPDFRIIPVLGEAQLIERELFVEYRTEIQENRWQELQTSETLPDLWYKCRVPNWSVQVTHVVVPSCEIISDERQPIGIFIPASLLRVSFTDGIDHKVLMIFETEETCLSQHDSSQGIWLWQHPEKSSLQIGWLRKAPIEWKPMGRLLLCLSPKMESPSKEAETFLEVDEVF